VVTGGLARLNAPRADENGSNSLERLFSLSSRRFNPSLSENLDISLRFGFENYTRSFFSRTKK
jgi:hypothetical protein